MRKGNQSSRACSLCRLKRTKCSGTQPCDRCLAHHEECNFHQQAHESKASLRTQIKELKQAEHDSQLIFDVLRGGKGSRAILNALQQNVSLQDIASALSDPNGAWALTDDGSRSESSASSFSQHRPSSELGRVVNSGASFNVSPVSSNTTNSSPWIMCQDPTLDTTGMPPPVGQMGDVLNQVAPGYRHLYHRQIPPAPGQYYAASDGLHEGGHAQWTGLFRSGSVACGDPMGA